MKIPSLQGDLIKSVSFAPYRRGQDPAIHLNPTHEQIESDLNVLKDIVSGVRTYTTQDGLEIVPSLASRYGMTVIHSAWIGSDKDANEKEISALIDQANRYTDTIKRVIVGSEVLLRKNVNIHELISYIRKVRKAVKQPVSYADVWEKWLEHSELAKEVDYITVHILPYWENNPMEIDKVMDHIRKTYEKIHETFPKKPILIGEVGWPTAGRSREKAVPGLVNAAKFHHEFLNFATYSNWDYNIIEAFDQLWKIQLEGTVGGHWGLMDSSRNLKFRLGQPVIENPDWLTGFITSSLLAVLSFFGVMGKRRLTGIAQPAFMVIISQILSVMLLAAFFHIMKNDFFSYAQLMGKLFILSLQCFIVYLILIESKMKLNTGILISDHCSSCTKTIDWMVSGIGVMAIYQTSMLIIDGRYRDFPTHDFLVPAFGLPLARWMTNLIRYEFKKIFSIFNFYWAYRKITKQEVVSKGNNCFIILAQLGMIFMLVSGAGILMHIEKLTNSESLLWGTTLFSLSMPHIATAFILLRLWRINDKTFNYYSGL